MPFGTIIKSERNKKDIPVPRQICFSKWFTIFDLIHFQYEAVSTVLLRDFVLQSVTDLWTLSKLYINILQFNTIVNNLCKCINKMCSYHRVEKIGYLVIINQYTSAPWRLHSSKKTFNDSTNQQGALLKKKRGRDLVKKRFTRGPVKDDWNTYSNYTVFKSVCCIH